MTDKKISELTNITGANVDDANDEIAIVDASANETKAITRAELFKSVSSVTIDGDLTVDTNTLFVDASTNRVGIGTSSPGAKLDVSTTSGLIARFTNGSSGGTPNTTHGELIVESGQANMGVQLLGTNTSNQRILFGDVASGGAGQIEYNHASDNMVLHTGTTERMRITSTGNVGIGTSSPNNRLHVNSGATNVAAIFESSSSEGKIRVVNGTDNAYISASSGGAHFGTSSNNNFNLIVDSSGNVGIGKSDPTRELDVAGTIRAGVLSSGNLTVAPGSSGAFITDNGLIVGSIEDGASLNIRREGTDGNLAQFFNDTSLVGTISVSGASTSYNTSSDYRLKEDLKPIPNPSDRVLALNPVNFAWKATGSRVDGFLAHEAQEVVPEAVTGEKDGEDMQAIDQSKLVPLLTAALQDALKRIQALEGGTEGTPTTSSHITQRNACNC
jgi:hypothetical protein